MRRICVFCGSSPGSRPEYGAAAEEMGAELARRNIGLVYGGGNVGLMGIIAEALMADLSDAFVALPGGFGTLEELCEVVTWTQLGLHAKPSGVLNVLGYYSPRLAMFDHAVEERFLKPENRALLIARESPADLLQALEEWSPVQVEKWLSRETR